MSKICINTLTGIPAGGKSTFCQKIQSEAMNFNVIHICYDDFIQIPTTENDIYFQSKQYKQQRLSLAWLIHQLVEDLKEKNDFSKFRQVMASDFPTVHFPLMVDSSKEYFLLLIDDTMHYKSMRKQIRMIARTHEIGYFVTYVHTSIDDAISRNRHRGYTVDENHLKRMFAIFEPPNDEDGELLHLNTDECNEIATNSVELIAFKCIDCPLKVTAIENNPAMEQTVVHKVDLMLRKSINLRMKNSKYTESVDLRELAKVLCAKRLFVLNEIRMGRIDLPENLDDLSVFVN